MRNGQKMSDWQDNGKKKIKEEQEKLKLDPCIVCHKVISDGFYARFGNGGVCSRVCMKIQDLIPLFPGHTEEDYFRRLHDSVPESETERVADE